MSDRLCAVHFCSHLRKPFSAGHRQACIRAPATFKVLSHRLKIMTCIQSPSSSSCLMAAISCRLSRSSFIPFRLVGGCLQCFDANIIFIKVPGECLRLVTAFSLQFVHVSSPRLSRQTTDHLSHSASIYCLIQSENGSLAVFRANLGLFHG